MKKAVKCGNIIIGGDHPVSIQSMLNVKTEDVTACIDQIKRLEDTGCDIVRLAVPNEDAVKALAKIREATDMPLVADIHFDYRLAIGAMDAGANKVRINPGNIGDEEKIKAVVDKAKEKNIPIRVGVNSGSLEKDILERDGGVTAKGLVESAVENVKILEELDFYDIVISIKASDVKMTIEAYELLEDEQSKRENRYPLHIGVTEAGTKESGIVKSSVGMGYLILKGIGDTMRVSLTADPVQEVMAAQKILASCGLREEPINIVSCPTCGRTKVDLETIVSDVERSLFPIGKERAKVGKKPLTIAVMGCEVNGPGEAREADIGVACGAGKGALFVKGEILRTVDEKDISSELAKMVEDHE